MKPLGVMLSGRIPAEVAADPGRVVGRLTDIGWGSRLRRMLVGSAPDAPLPDEVFDAVVQVLAAWDWPRRPAGVVTLPSHTRPELITGLGERIARTGRLPYLGGLGYASLPGRAWLRERYPRRPPAQKRTAAARVVASDDGPGTAAGVSRGG